jgi:drug/metabolite transporter (DMT)-like permease
VETLFYLPIVLAVLCATVYHLGQKAIPVRVNPMVSLTVSYVTALALSLALLPFFPKHPDVSESLRNLNWGTYAVGVSIVGVELAFLLVYRVGWKLSLASVTSNVATAVLLVALGTLWFGEHLSTRNVVGLAFCLAGLALVTH